MGTRRIRVLCTHGGSDQSVTFPDLYIDHEGVITQARARIAASPVTGHVTGFVDGEPVSGELTEKAVVPVASHRDHAGSWRWKCPRKRCSVDVQLHESALRRWISDTPSASLDLSNAPR